MIVALVAATCSVAAAQQLAQPILTFKEAVRIGLENNLNLNQQENLLVATKVDKTSGFLSMGPTVSISGNTGRNDGNSFNPQEGKVINGVLDFTSASINASMPLFRGLNALNSYKRTVSLYEAQLQNVNRTRQDVIRYIAQQYLTCLLGRSLVVINEKNLETQQQQHEQIQAQVDAGARAEVDLKNQEYQVKNAHLLLLRARNTLRNNKAELAQVLQLDPATAFDLQEPGWAVETTGVPDGVTLAALYAIGAEKRSDLKQAHFSEEAAKFGYQATKGDFFPNINLFASYGSAYNYVHGIAGNRGFEQQFTSDNTQLTYGISFRIPVYSAFQIRSNTVSARVQYENARLSSENLSLAVKSDILLAYQNLQDAQASFEAAEAQLEAGRISNSLERERYLLGISDIVALTQANQVLTQAEVDMESARYTLMFRKLLVDYATGALKFEDIP